ncbi:hypothetical protein THTE_4295 [Thermogutta terrifontis]|uniref:Uncharacterized protein n=1 Tax=Thermogutta terrifontis TaxID=1331910 RepID=A0A286RLQ8_9BACT|nr:hypothetical protein THTE_4295 [Thermogutta terrifontis]
MRCHDTSFRQKISRRFAGPELRFRSVRQKTGFRRLAGAHE